MNHVSGHRLSSGALLVAVCVACSSADTNGSRGQAALTPAQEDSAGVTLYSHADDAMARAPRLILDSVPLVEYVGSIEDEAHDISTVRNLMFLSDGQLVGLENDPSHVVLLGADGQVRRMGTPGAGPLELGEYLDVVVTTGDTVFVSDVINNRFTSLTADSGLLASTPLTAAQGLANTMVIGKRADGLMLLRQRSYRLQPGMNGIQRPEFGYSVWRAGEDSVRPAFTAPVGEMNQEVRKMSDGRTLVMARQIPFTTVSSVVASGDGFVMTTGDRWRVEWRDTTGAVRQVLSIPVTRRDVSTAVWNSYTDEAVAQQVARTPDINRDSVRAEVLQTVHADSLPVIERLLASPDGLLWAFDPAVPGDSSWAITVFDNRGRVRGRLAATHGPRPVAVGNGRVLLRREDELGIATLSVHRVDIPQ